MPLHKGSLSLHQKRIRFLTVLAATVVIGLGLGIIFLISHAAPVGH